MGVELRATGPRQEEQGVIDKYRQKKAKKQTKQTQNGISKAEKCHTVTQFKDLSQRIH